MQFFRKDVLSAPTSFFVFASFKQAVRLACFTAASLDMGPVAGAGEGDGAAGVSANPPAAGNRQIDTATATIALRMGISLMEPG
jgi:hypothetical protein